MPGSSLLSAVTEANETRAGDPRPQRHLTSIAPTGVLATTQTSISSKYDLFFFIIIEFNIFI